MGFVKAVVSAGTYAPCSRQITTPTPHHSIFTGWMLFLFTGLQCFDAVGWAAGRASGL